MPSETTEPRNEATPAPRPPQEPTEPVHQISGWRRALLWPLGALVRLWGRTLRFEVGEEDLRHLRKIDEPVAFVLWHNRLFVTPEVWRRYRQGRPLYALVSASQDGAWLTAFFSLVGLSAVRGSSSRLGREAATALVGVLRAGHDVGITPDGPRGPRYELKPGALIVARRTQTPLLLLGAEFRSAWQLRRAWDHFYLPKPFSRVRLHCDYVPASALAEAKTAAATLEARLREISAD